MSSINELELQTQYIALEYIINTLRRTFSRDATRIITDKTRGLFNMLELENDLEHVTSRTARNKLIHDILNQIELQGKSYKLDSSQVSRAKALFNTIMQSL